MFSHVYDYGINCILDNEASIHILGRYGVDESSNILFSQNRYDSMNFTINHGNWIVESFGDDDIPKLKWKCAVVKHDRDLWER